ncbi:glycosyltransferase family 39 protein [Candidatus Daviesbacteria bacterium]|nr:glycosyltransferase family 39 protein [Candidatus Daviesbacteria bacterium]
MNQYNKILFLATLGLIIRLLLSFLPGFKIDMGDWFAWSIRLSNFNFSQFYSKDVFTDYTPGYLYILSILGFLKNHLQIPDNQFYLLLKLPAIIAELILGLLIYKEARKFVSEKLAFLAFCLVLFQPALIFNSSIWGQVDSVLTLFMLIAVIALIRNNLILSSISFGISLLVKPQAIALIPLFAIFLVNHFKLSNLIKLLLPALSAIFILTFPFFSDQTLINLSKHILNTANEYSYTSINAYNLWGTVGFWIPDVTVWNSISYQNWGYILLTSYWIVITYLYFRKRLSIYAVAALATLGFFFLPTRVHERYLYPALVFLVLLTATYRSKLLLALTGLLSILHFLNLYYVYVYYNEFYFQLPKVLYNPIIYNFLEASSKNLSLLSTIIFISITIGIIKYHAKPYDN